MNKDFKEHFDFFLKKVREGENFALARFSDGEMFIMQNIEVILDENLIQVDGKRQSGGYTQEDFKSFVPEKDQVVREYLLEAFAHVQDGYYKGLSCPCCVGTESSNWMKGLAGTDDKHLTWANIWVNGNYPRFVQEMIPALKNREVVFVCNENANLEGLPFEVVKDFRVGYNCPVNDIDLLLKMSRWINNLKGESIKDHVFLFSAASLSELLIHGLYKHFPENTYIDVGTCFNKQLGFSIRRGYLGGYWNGTGHPNLFKKCRW